VNGRWRLVGYWVHELWNHSVGSPHQQLEARKAELFAQRSTTPSTHPTLDERVERTRVGSASSGAIPSDAERGGDVRGAGGSAAAVHGPLLSGAEPLFRRLGGGVGDALGGEARAGATTNGRRRGRKRKIMPASLRADVVKV
jgi:hypothetical protein